MKCIISHIPAPAKTRFDLREKFALLHVWAMTVYDIVLFLDADTLVNNALDSILDLDLQGKTIGVTNSEEIFWDEHPLDQINVIHYTMKKPWK